MYFFQATKKVRGSSKVTSPLFPESEFDIGQEEMGAGASIAISPSAEGHISSGTTLCCWSQQDTLPPKGVL